MTKKQCLQERGALIEKRCGRDEMKVVRETPLLRLEEEMDINEGTMKLLKRKMEGGQEHC